MDELLTAPTVQLIKQCRVQAPVFFNIDWLYYSFNHSHAPQYAWPHPEAVSVAQLAQPTSMRLSQLRYLRDQNETQLADELGATVLSGAGWHCSYFGGVGAVARKLTWVVEGDSRAGAEVEGLRRLVAEGRDPYQREGNRYKLYVKADPPLPWFVAANPLLLRHLTHPLLTPWAETQDSSIRHVFQRWKHQGVSSASSAPPHDSSHAASAGVPATALAFLYPTDGSSVHPTDTSGYSAAVSSPQASGGLQLLVRCVFPRSTMLQDGARVCGELKQEPGSMDPYAQVLK
jgi:hypothetical protein